MSRRKKGAQLAFGFPIETMTRRQLRATKLSWVLSLLLGQKPLKRVRYQMVQPAPAANGEQTET